MTGKLKDDDAASALHDLAGLPLRRIVHTGLLDRAWSLRHRVSFYDGIYVPRRAAWGPLLTLDVRLAKAAAATRIEVLTAA